MTYSSTILNTFRFQKIAYGPLVHAWTTSHFEKNETVSCDLARNVPEPFEGSIPSRKHLRAKVTLALNTPNALGRYPTVLSIFLYDLVTLPLWNA